MKHAKLEGGRYASAAHELCADLQSYFGLDEARAVELSFRWKAEFGRAISTGQATVKYGAKLDKEARITLGDAMGKIKTHETPVLQLAAACSSLRQFAKRFNGCQVESVQMCGYVNEYVAGLTVTELEVKA